MNSLIVNKISFKVFNKYPDKIKEFEIGYGNYVYRISFGNEKFVIRISLEQNAYKDTIYWLNKLNDLELPVHKVIAIGEYEELSYLVLNYIEGDDLGTIYGNLSEYEKREIAAKLVKIQAITSTLPKNRGYGYVSSYEDENYKNSWKEVIIEHLNRSRNRIKENQIFDCKKVERVERLLEKYNEYLNDIKPIAFLDDLSSKNVLIDNGKLSGIIDFDWICFGDKLYYVALTNMALISLGYDTKYVDYIMEEMNASELEREILKLYTLIFCLDFMGEKGMSFKGKVVEVNKDVVENLNRVYIGIYNELESKFY